METPDKVQVRGRKDVEGWVVGPTKGREFKYQWQELAGGEYIGDGRGREKWDRLVLEDSISLPPSPFLPFFLLLPLPSP